MIPAGKGWNTPISDEFDALLAERDGWGAEELDLVINYDIKYRMGDELEGSEDQRMSGPPEKHEEHRSLPGEQEITRFELRPEICGLIPLEDARRLGVLPFERIRNEVMLAVLNPVDSDVSRMVSRHLGCKTHVFLTSPAEFHRAIEQLARPAP